MIAGLYISGDSPVHRAAPGVKLFALVVGATLLFMLPGLHSALAGLALTLALYRLARIPFRYIWLQFRALIPVLLLIGVSQLILGDKASIAPVLLRLLAVVLAGGLVTLTTRSLEMIDAIERGLQPFRAVISPQRVALAISLAIRFIPVVGAVFAEVREAQAARGLDRNLFALAVPIILRTLKMTDEIAEAIDARS